MYLTGFADEAAKNIDGQIRVTKELGWKYIESRNIDGINIHDLSEGEFDKVYGKLRDAEIQINCFGSAIANWGKQIYDPATPSLEEAKRAIPRMKKLGTSLIRVMSFALIPGKDPWDQIPLERFQRLRLLQKMFSDEGLIMVHENCMNYGGMGWTYTLELVEKIPGLKLVFDTGNPITDDDYTKSKPYPKQSSWEFYQHVKEFIEYVHIKDGIWDLQNNKPIFTYPGEGHGDVRRIVKDLIDSGYDGGFSIEPHMTSMAHDPSIHSPEEIAYKTYLQYGRRMEKILSETKSGN